MRTDTTVLTIISNSELSNTYVYKQNVFFVCTYVCKYICMYAKMYVNSLCAGVCEFKFLY